MKRLSLLFVLFLGAITINAQEEKKEETKDGWTKGGNVSFLLNQSAFSNWQLGGTNNVAGNLGLNYDFNYVKGDLTWDNKIIAAYGLSRNQGERTKKTDDRLEFNSLVGLKATGNWSYSFFLNFRTQFDEGFDPDDESVRISEFFSPAYLQFGPGMLWKKHDNLKFNLAPLTSRMIFVKEEYTTNGESFGVEQGDTFRYEFGFSASAYYKFDLMENVSVENILGLYSNYLEDPQNVDIDYTLNVVMQINKYLSTNLSFQTLYDDNAFKGFQIREVFGVGVNYGF